tara:strand:- start:114 stop:290 length:177 start_codon:yes stop_codon:yes gene_type:complete
MINLWINSLSTERDIKLEVKISKEGARKQCRTHIKDNATADLSVIGCIFIIQINPKLC